MIDYNVYEKVGEIGRDDMYTLSLEKLCSLYKEPCIYKGITYVKIGYRYNIYVDMPNSILYSKYHFRATSPSELVVVKLRMAVKERYIL